MANATLLNVREAARELGVHPQTVKKLLRDGDLPGVKVGRQWRIRSDELEEFTSSKPRRP